MHSPVNMLTKMYLTLTLENTAQVRVSGLTILSRFQAMKSVNAHPMLPQSDSDSELEVLVQRG